MTPICSAPSAGPTRVRLVGPPLATGAGILRAKANEPSAATGTVRWTVDLEFTPASAAVLRAYTRQHHSASEGTCSGVSVACSDFLVLTTDDQVRIEPLTLAPIGASITISGALDRLTARSLAADFGAAAIALQPG